MEVGMKGRGGVQNIAGLPLISQPAYASGKAYLLERDGRP